MYLQYLQPLRQVRAVRLAAGRETVHLLLAPHEPVALGRQHLVLVRQIHRADLFMWVVGWLVCIEGRVVSTTAPDR